MYRVESLKLFGDISKVSDKYKSWHLKDDENEIKDNRKLKTLLNYHNSRFDHIKEKYDFLSYQTKNELKNKSKYELHKILNEFNNFSYKKFSSLKNSNIDSTTVKAVMFATIDELYLINESIRKRDYLENKKESAKKQLSYVKCSFKCIYNIFIIKRYEYNKTRKSKRFITGYIYSNSIYSHFFYIKKF